MNSNFLSSKLDSEYIKALTILKLKKNYKVIEDEEYKSMLLDLTITNGYSDFTEILSMTAFEIIIDRIENMESKEEVKILFNEKVEVLYKNKFIDKNCDVVLIGKETIEVISIIPFEFHYIFAFDDEESQLLGMGILNKHLSSINCKYLTLTVVQPNLIENSVYGASVDRFLHQYDFSLLWE
ncbi:hypothetical protein [Clostridium sp. 1001271B_151109_B4]|uniref:hypothetical protein n=1 Tax=Clostridium sp. 1001271B_151109_B4 TaxID=2787148 RepID=UPI0018AC895D|nr:hypothetical protein [Clostridium sp. 1001271B_151109_B4]